MNLQNYVQEALRTESKIENVKTDAPIFINVLNAVIAAGTLMDLLKKNIFYNTPIKATTFSRNVALLRDSITDLPCWSVSDDDDHDIGATSDWVRIDLGVEPRVFHSIVGAITEAAELGQALREVIYGTPLDNVNVLEEFGDINWYQAIATDALGGSFEQTLKRNIDKLRARFPERYSDERANNRDLQVERLILEGE